ncbi:PLP-dependent aminotransferase family protein [Rhodococcus sp. HNM0569]|uniref:aminotransferase-like domain-containing protein n=1 Tax=Rhodococcus sp. HNM0569 TaxID=2716340 RepID=UPI00146C946B|nr:PLP-dependent aminotransferase family protein [Rhodococcus sp. HNM0569]NLU81870.1 PLP-dependent aminotransferase family protein [Rhodococcus sp. HNM0569]
MSLAFSSRMAELRSSAIRDLLSLTAKPEILSLAGGLPAPEFLDRERVAAEAARVLAAPSSVQYGETVGSRDVRDAIARFDRCGRDLDGDHIVVTNGSQQALSLVAQVVLDPGDDVVLESPAYTGALQVFQAAQARITTVPLDDDGLDVEALTTLLENGLRPKLVHTVANFHNPRGVVLADDRRRALAALAERYDFRIVEDDPYGRLWFDVAPPASLAAYSDRVVRLSSVSKILVPALRVGWLHADAELCSAVERLKQSADLCGSSLTQQIAAGLLDDRQWLDPHVDRVRAAYRARAATLVDALEAAFGDDVTVSRPRGGMFCWVRFGGGVDTELLLTDAADEGVAFVPGAAFSPDAEPAWGRSGARLCFVTYREELLVEAVGRLHGAWSRHVRVRACAHARS